MATSEASGEPEGTESPHGLDDYVLSVKVEDVYREEHEEGVDGRARRQEEALILGQAATAEEPHHPRPQAIGAPHASRHFVPSRNVPHLQHFATHFTKVS
jgi:hypothetical protein